MSKRKLFILRGIAVFLVLNILLEVFSPTISYALTSGPVTPEVFGYQPSDATDNVNLATGDFNYTIPITSIPEYPMAIGYSSNAGGAMDADASSFGFGVNGFSGAIARSIQGLPDDISNGVRMYTYDNLTRKDWTGTVGGGVGIPIKGLPDQSQYGVTPTVGGSLSIGYDNYTGLHGSAGFNVGISISEIGEKGPTSFGGGINAGFDPQYGAFGSLGIGYNGFTSFVSYSSSLDRVSSGIGISLSTVGVGQITVERDGITKFNTTTNGLSSYLPQLSTMIADTKSSSFSASFSIPIGIAYVSLGVSHYEMHYGNMKSRKQSYGFMYLNNYDRKNDDHIADVSIEGENSYSYSMTPSMLQRDYFVVNAQGFSGSMQLFQNEYGVVSRNYNRYDEESSGLLKTGKQIKEIAPWTHVAKTVINKHIDIIEVLKKKYSIDAKDKDLDFDNVLFTEEELVSLTDADHKFDNTAKFKMRGDLAGDLNLSSSSYNDYEPNSYEIRYLTGSNTDKRYFFLGQESKIPIYYPAFTNETSAKLHKNNQMINSTNISYYTVGQILAAHNSSPWKNFDPYTNGNNPTTYKFQESFLCHNTYVNTSSRQDTLSLNSTNIRSFNVLKHLSDLRGSSSYFDNLIGDIRVRTAEGLTYVYNLPAFSYSTKNLMLRGHGDLPPKDDANQNDYHSSIDKSKIVESDKEAVTDQFKYPYAWMLTAVIGPDYIDFDDVPGPSEGDLGSWVKFKYVKAADSYKWRNPYIGMRHNPGAIYNMQDDSYMAMTGYKEIYYVSEIESANHVSKFQYGKRFDGVDAGGNDIWNGSASNSINQIQTTPSQPTGNNFPFAVTRVELYKKNFEGDNSSVRKVSNRKGQLLRATEFKYDYTVCPNTLNNLTTYKGAHTEYDIKVGSLPYHIDHSDPEKATTSIGTGKLTLRKVQHISYEGGDPVYLPGYDLTYGFDGKNYNNPAGTDYSPEYNPEFDDQQVDQWGNYSAKSKLTVNNTYVRNAADASHPGPIDYYNNYVELTKSQADKNALAFKLSKVYLPSGGSLTVDYESKAYGKVQDKVPYVMRKISSINYDNTSHTFTAKIDITDLAEDGKNLDSILNVNDVVYGEVAFYESNSTNYPKREDDIFVSSEDAKIGSFGSITTGSDGRTYQDIILNHKSNPSWIAFVSQYKGYLFNDSDKMKVIQDKLNSPGAVPNCDLNGIIYKYKTLEKAKLKEAVTKFVENIKSYYIPNAAYVPTFYDCFGDASHQIFSHQSYIRTPIYKSKYTGSRVKGLSFSDNFQYATMSDGSSGPKDNVYTTNYFYDANGNGIGSSEGVATVEPGGGKSSVIDLYNYRGASFMPAPSILQAKTTVQNAYNDLTGSVGDTISRYKGKTEYHFYTCKDDNLKFENNFRKSQYQKQPGKAIGHFYMFGVMAYRIFKFKLFKKVRTIKIPLPIPVLVLWDRMDNYYLFSYSYVDQSDMIGKVKKVVYLNSDGKEVRKTEMKYFDKNEGMNVYNGSNGGPTQDPFSKSASTMKLGRMDQTWSEAYYTKESSVTMMPWFLTLIADTERKFSYTNVKQTYLPPVLKQTTTWNAIDGSLNTTNYTAFDYYTGQPLQVELMDSYNNTKIQRITPAYWKYPIMGPTTASSPDNLNMLTQPTANYVYLNSVNNSNVLAASITEWTKDSIKMVSSVRNLGKQWASNNTDFNYAYEKIGGDTLEKIYNINGKARTSLASGISSKITNEFIAVPSKIVKPYKTYTYEVGLNTNGTFALFTPFNYSLSTQSDAKWKLLSTSTYHDMYGNVVETKDILDKYAAAYLGYNFSNSVAAVGNSTWKQSAYAGAENQYSTTAGGKLLDDYRVGLNQAEIFSGEPKTFINKTLVYSSLTTTNAAKVVNVCVPSSPVLNVPFAKVNVSYLNSKNQTMNRSFFISYNENKNFKIITDQGESFRGFVVLPNKFQAGCKINYKIAFDRTVFTAFTLDNSFTNSGYSATVTTEILKSCLINDVPYTLPDNNAYEVHTGKYAFALQAGNKGTVFTVDLSSLPVSEGSRKYSSMVWVHNSSPVQTTLVVANQSGTVLKSTTLSTPVVRAGNWSLLRLDVDPTEYGAATKLIFSVKNNSSAGIAVYDDYRVTPYQATMENYVYDHFTGRISAKLNQDNIATFFIYDSKGRLLEVKAEIENIGKQTIKKYQYNEQKQN